MKTYTDSQPPSKQRVAGSSPAGIATQKPNTIAGLQSFQTSQNRISDFTTLNLFSPQNRSSIRGKFGEFTAFHPGSFVVPNIKNKGDLEMGKIVRTSVGLRDALFDEFDALREGKSNPGRASAAARIASQILSSIQAEIGYQRHVTSLPDASSGIVGPAPILLGTQKCVLA